MAGGLADSRAVGQNGILSCFFPEIMHKQMRCFFGALINDIKRYRGMGGIFYIIYPYTLNIFL
jgi:hypothetical protein